MEVECPNYWVLWVKWSVTSSIFTYKVNKLKQNFLLHYLRFISAKFWVKREHKFDAMETSEFFNEKSIWGNDQDQPLIEGEPNEEDKRLNSDSFQL